MDTSAPHVFTLAVQEAQAEARAVSVSSTKKGSGIQTLDDLRSKSFNFVDPASTAGHLMPKTILIKYGIDPDDPANEMITVFAGSHPSTKAEYLGLSPLTISKFRGDCPAAAHYRAQACSQDQICRLLEG